MLTAAVQAALNRKSNKETGPSDDDLAKVTSFHRSLSVHHAAMSANVVRTTLMHHARLSVALGAVRHTPEGRLNIFGSIRLKFGGSNREWGTANVTVLWTIDKLFSCVSVISHSLLTRMSNEDS